MVTLVNSYEKYLDEHNAQEVYWSAECNLAMTKGEGGDLLGDKYHVVNGRWTGILLGTTFTIEGSRGTLEITDLKKIALGDMPTAWQAAYYFDPPMSEEVWNRSQEWDELFDNDIAF